MGVAHQFQTSVSLGSGVQGEVARQYPTKPDDFICQDCWFWKGGVGCKKGYFIAFTGANTSGCTGFDDGPKTPAQVRGMGHALYDLAQR